MEKDMIIALIKGNEQITEDMKEKLIYYFNMVHNEFERLEDIEDRVSMLQQDNAEKIEEMRPYKDVSPFDFGVLNGIDEACRIILRGKNEK